MKRTLSIILAILICISIFTLSICANDGMAQAVTKESQGFNIAIGEWEIPQDIIEYFENFEVNSVLDVIILIVVGICALVALVVAAIILVILIVVILAIVIEVVIPILATISAGLAPIVLAVGGFIEFVFPYLVGLLLPVVDSIAPDLANLIMELLRELVGYGAIILPLI